MGNSVENAILRKAGVENGATAERAEIQGSEGSRWKGDTGKWNQQEKETEIKTGKKQRREMIKRDLQKTEDGRRRMPEKSRTLE